MRQLPFIFILLIPFFGCVSKKNHLAYIDSLNKTHESTLQTFQADFNSRLSTADSTVRSLELQLSERKGENNILVQLRQELTDSIDFLQSNLQGLSQQSASTQENLNSTLVQKDQQIKKLKDQLQSIDLVLNKHIAALSRLAGDLRFILQELDPALYEMLTTQMQLKVSVVASLIFERGSNSRITDEGYDLLAKMAAIFARNPNMLIQLTGHTDNSPPRRKADGDNWNVSVIRGANITRLMIQEFDLSPNQLTAAGKGEYAPISSNATTEGKTKNKRMEFIIAPRSEDLVKAVKAKLGR